MLTGGDQGVRHRRQYLARPRGNLAMPVALQLTQKLNLSLDARFGLADVSPSLLNGGSLTGETPVTTKCL
jgi:hypothetical protein